jgi:hypothetical protein
MNESISLAVTFLAIVIVYEFLKPKSNNDSRNQTKDTTNEED